MNKFRQFLHIFVVFSFVFLQVQPVFAATESGVSKSSNYKLFNGQVNPIVGRADDGNLKWQAGGREIAGRQTSVNYKVQQGSIFGWPPAATTQQQAGGGGGGSFSAADSPSSEYEAEIQSLSVTQITTSSAAISFQLKEAARAFIRYGTDGTIVTTTYKDGSLKRSHKITLRDLIPNTGYIFRIHLENSQDQNFVSSPHSFTTLPEFKTPPSVSNFQAVVIGDVAQLTWKNPDIKDLKEIKVVRSTEQFPTSLSEGQLIFSGMAEYYFDKQIKRGETYYYSVFAVDHSANISSGAVDSITFGEVEPEAPAEEERPEEEPAPPQEPTKPDIIKEIEEKIGKEITDLTTEQLIEELEKRIRKVLKEREEKEKEFVIPVEEPTDKDFEITIPAKPPPIPEIATPVQPEESSTAEGSMNIFTLFEQEISESLDKVAQKIKEAVTSTREKLKEVNKDLVTQDNQIRPDVYESLNEQQKKRVQEIMDVKPSTTTRRTAAKIIPHTIKAERADADWHVYSDSTALFTIPADAFQKDVKSITVTINKEGYVLQYNNKTGNYEAVIQAPSKKGKYEMIVQVFYKDNTYEQLKKTLLVDPYGYVYREVFKDWSWERPWQIFTTKRVAVPKAKVTLYHKNQTGQWVKWPGHLYNQYNPQYTAKTGRFAFVAPPGEYYLEVQTDKYGDAKTEPFEVKDKIINKNIEVGKLSTRMIWSSVIGGVIILLSVGFYSLVRNRRRKKQSQSIDERKHEQTNNDE